MAARKASVLVYAILVVSAMLASAVAISSLLSGSIRQSRFELDAAGAYYSAESGVEKALYQIRTKDSLPAVGDCGFAGIGCEIAVVSDDVREITVPYVQNETIQFDLFNPDNNLVGAGVECVKFEAENPAAIIEVTSVDWPAGASVAWQAYPNQPVQKRIFTGATNIDNFFAAAKNYRTRVKFLNSVPGTMKITLGNDGACAAKLPFPNYLVVKATGNYLNASRTVSVKMQRYAPMVGLFDYVLFSEEKLTK